MLLAITTLAGRVDGVLAQQQVEPQRSPKCPACRIERVVVGVLDTSAVDGSYLVKSLLPGPSGSLWVTSWPGRVSHPPQLFSSNFRREEVLGREGEGPLEFRSAPNMVRLRSDSLAVFDMVLGRVTIVDPQLRYARSVPDVHLARLYEAVGLPDGRIVGSGPLRIPGAERRPLHEYDRDLKYRRSFGDTPSGSIPGEFALVRRLGVATDSGLWVAHMITYRIEKWTKDLRLAKSVTRVAPWFPPPSPVTAMSGEPPKPQPAIASIFEDDKGLLWVCVRVADKDWRSALGKPFIAGGVRRYKVEDENGYTDSIIEVFDAQSLELVASARFDDALIGVFDGHLTGALTLDANAAPRFVVWKVVLRPASPIKQ